MLFRTSFVQLLDFPSRVRKLEACVSAYGIHGHEALGTGRLAVTTFISDGGAS
jgi:hypothetical protein